MKLENKDKILAEYIKHKAIYNLLDTLFNDNERNKVIYILSRIYKINYYYKRIYKCNLPIAMKVSLLKYVKEGDINNLKNSTLNDFEKNSLTNYIVGTYRNYIRKINFIK